MRYGIIRGHRSYPAINEKKKKKIKENQIRILVFLKIRLNVSGVLRGFGSEKVCTYSDGEKRKEGKNQSVSDSPDASFRIAPASTAVHKPDRDWIKEAIEGGKKEERKNGDAERNTERDSFLSGETVMEIKSIIRENFAI